MVLVRRLIDKWLKAGVMEQGQLSFPESGRPRVVLSHPRVCQRFSCIMYVLDGWFVEQRATAPAESSSTLVGAYCDDLSCYSRAKEAANGCMRVLGKRLAKFRVGTPSGQDPG